GNDLGALDGVSAGLGFVYSNYGIDYAYVPFGEYAETHRVSLNIFFD
ncbi:MAG: hypothetical protein GY817_00585, partial [bacterium]|nr:hypothetical protein [bacterium]